MNRSRISITNDQALELFSSDSYLTVNKRLLGHYGPEVAVFLCNLVDKFRYFQHNHQLENGEWFYLIHTQQMEQTGLTETKLRRCKVVLRKDKVIETRMGGRPAKEKYKLQLINLIKILEFKTSQNLRARPKETVGLINKENINKDIKKKLNKKISLDSINELLPQEWQDHKPLQELLSEFILHREQLKRPLTPVAIKRLTNKLTQYSIPTVIEALKKSIESGWTGVFPESIKTTEEDKPTKGPREVIQEYFKGKKDAMYADTFYKGVYTEAENLLTDISNGQCFTLARNIVGLYDWIESNQTEEIKHTLNIPTPVNLIAEYVGWLERQDWLDIEPSMFTHTHTIWKRKFLAKKNSEYGVNIITGKYFK